MPKFSKKEKYLITSKRHFTVVIKNKENGLYISSTPSLAAKKAVSKLCASNKSKKVEFYIREITHDSKKKTYGPYIGYLEKLKIPIKLKEYIIKYNPVAKLKKKFTVKKVGMKGGTKEIFKNITRKYNPELIIETKENLKDYKKFPKFSDFLIDFENFKTGTGHIINTTTVNPVKEYNDKKASFIFRDDITDEILQTFIQTQSQKMIKKFQELGLQKNVIVYLNVPYKNDDEESEPTYERIEYLNYEPDVASSAHNLDSGSEVSSSHNSNFSKIINSKHNTRNNIYLNCALQFIGIINVLKLFHTFLIAFNDRLQIISVGSGMAYFEYLIQEVFKRRVICVDPKPMEFNPGGIPFSSSSKKLFIIPEFNIVNTLLSSNNSNKYTDCLLVLNWPTQHIGPYDFDAIIKLKPLGFFIIYEGEGIAGSEKLINKLSETNPKFSEDLSYKLLIKEEREEYKILGETTRMLPTII